MEIEIALIMQLNAWAAESTVFTTALSLTSFMALITYFNLLTDHLGIGLRSQYKNDKHYNTLIQHTFLRISNRTHIDVLNNLHFLLVEKIQ